MRSKLLAIAGATAFSATAFSQDPPALKTNQSNEAAEAPVQRASPSGVGGAVNGMKRFAAPAPQNGPYGMFDLRHTTTDYYGADDARLKRDLALHAKLRIGAKFYGETLDISAGVGGAKLPGSQRTYQKRPDVTVDMYPLKGRVFKILAYANAYFPVRQTDQDPTEFSDGDRYDKDYRRAMDATVMSVGLAPAMKLEGSFGVGKISTTFGLDGWTRMYSKPLYIEESASVRSLGLIKEDENQVDKPFEDTAMRYVHQESAALGYTPSIWPRLQVEYAGYYESRYLPRYFQNETDSSWDYTYQPERISFSRLKINLDLTQAASLSNELYYFRNGFFAEDRINDQRRFKNIVRLAFKL
jgi:hypothetical protein